MSFYKKNNVVLRFNNIIEVICGFLGLILLIICVIQVILRVSFALVLTWSFEASALLSVYFVFLGLSALILRRRTARVITFINIMPKFLNVFFNFIMNFSMVILGFALFIGGWEYKSTLSLWKMSNLPLSLGLLAYPIIFLGFTLSFQGFISFNRTIKEICHDKATVKNNCERI